MRKSNGGNQLNQFLFDDSSSHCPRPEELTRGESYQLMDQLYSGYLLDLMKLRF